MPRELMDAPKKSKGRAIVVLAGSMPMTAAYAGLGQEAAKDEGMRIAGARSYWTIPPYPDLDDRGVEE